MIFKQEMMTSEYIKALKINDSLITRSDISLMRLKRLKTCFNVHRNPCDEYLRIFSLIKTSSFRRLILKDFNDTMSR